MKKWLAPTLLASVLALAACGTDEVDKDEPMLDDDNVEAPSLDQNNDGIKDADQDDDNVKDRKSTRLNSSH